MLRFFAVLSTLFLLAAGTICWGNPAFCQGSRADGDFLVPADAIRLLAKSRKESCSVCIENLKEKAFGILAESMSPYTGFSAERNCPIVFSNDTGDPELQLSCYPDILNLSDEISEIPGIVFRFHTRDRHMIGISPDDFTDENTARYISSVPGKTLFRGELELVPYRYGDGPTFIYFSEINRLMIHCRLLAIEMAE